MESEIKNCSDLRLELEALRSRLFNLLDWERHKDSDGEEYPVAGMDDKDVNDRIYVFDFIQQAHDVICIALNNVKCTEAKELKNEKLC